MIFSAARRVLDMNRRHLVGLMPAIGLVLTIVGGPTVAVAQDRRPLVMEGTNTVYQRVLTRPRAQIHDDVAGSVILELPPFQPLYVFGSDAAWVEVGPTPRDVAGWIAEDQVIEWRQNIVAAFTNPADRSRQVLFSESSALMELMGHEAVRSMQAQLLDAADNGALQPSDRVVAAEPQEFVNIQDELYLMPILQWEDVLHPVTYEDTLVMELASVPLREGPASEAVFAQGAAGDDFDAGVVFVMDTTRSMQPYVDRTRQALQRIVNEIGQTDIGDRITFGIVTFRDNPDAAPLEYRTNPRQLLNRDADVGQILQTMASVQVTSANSPGFNEDSLAGIEDAIDQNDWSSGDDPFDGRYIILVTDAGPKDPRDPNARSAIGPAELQRDAEGQRIAIMTLHLRTPEGEANHDYAASRYRALSRFAGNEYYFPIEGGSTDAFEDTVTRLVTTLTDHVRTALGQEAVLTPEETGDELVALGLAMRLAYLGTREGTQAPDVIRGWASERAVETPSRIAFEPRLLVTKNELSTMAEFIEQIVILGEQQQQQDDPDAFFSQLQSVMAQMAQNPDQLIDAEADTLGGALEFLEQLPYRSQIMNMDADTWRQSGMQRRQILDGLRQKLAQYGRWLRDPDVWTPLFNGAPDGEYVFAMPFDVLP
ncbi:MAG: vWA domain-containing protein [Pseudomonadota bacterium]